jgi:hypothetical protein
MLLILVKEVKDFAKNFYQKIQRFSFKPYYREHNNHELDNLLIKPEIILPYFKFEILIGFIFNLFVTFPTTYFLMKNLEYALACDKSLAIWAMAIVSIQLFQIPLKILLLAKFSEIYIQDQTQS